jgi:hypothetical protein
MFVCTAILCEQHQLPCLTPRHQVTRTHDTHILCYLASLPTIKSRARTTHTSHVLFTRCMHVQAGSAVSRLNEVVWTPKRDTQPCDT